MLQLPTRQILSVLVMTMHHIGALRGQEGGYRAPPFEYMVTAKNGTSLASPARNTLFICDVTAKLEDGTVIDFPKVLTLAAQTWVEGDRLIMSKIPVVNGSDTMAHEFEMTVNETSRRLKGNGIPNHPMGTYPIPQNTLAYEVYGALPAEGYPNAAEIPTEPYDLDITVPRYPKVSKDGPFCLSPVVSGVATQTGVAWHLEYASDASYQAVDPNAALFTDLCWGHPYETQYHYHGYSWKCFPDQGKKGEHSPLFGYAMDGFGIYGPYSENGVFVTNEDLDECHGHEHEIEWEGEMVNMYHYHLNNEYPYSVGCYKGEPVMIDPNQSGQVSIPLSISSDNDSSGSSSEAVSGSLPLFGASLFEHFRLIMIAVFFCTSRLLYP